MTETQGLLLAFGFGVLYNWLIVQVEQRGTRGVTGLWVVGGVFCTLLISAMVHVDLPPLYLLWLGQPLVLSNQQHAAFFELKFFAASGLPMVVGSLWRAMRDLQI